MTCAGLSSLERDRCSLVGPGVVPQLPLRLRLSWSGEERHGTEMLPRPETSPFGWSNGWDGAWRGSRAVRRVGTLFCVPWGAKDSFEQDGGVLNPSWAGGRFAGGPPPPGQREKAVPMYSVALGGEGGLKESHPCRLSYLGPEPSGNSLPGSCRPEGQGPGAEAGTAG